MLADETALSFAMLYCLAQLAVLLRKETLFLFESEEKLNLFQLQCLLRVPLNHNAIEDPLSQVAILDSYY